MNTVTLLLAENPCLEGTSWRFSEYVSRAANGRRELVLKIETASATRILTEAIDTSQGDGEDQITVVRQTGADRESVAAPAVLILGGACAYWLDGDARVVAVEHLFRDGTALEEYWRLDVISIAAGCVVIYESGVMLLGSMLRIKWHVKKYLNDVFEEVIGQEVWFIQDSGERWCANPQAAG